MGIVLYSFLSLVVSIVVVAIGLSNKVGGGISTVRVDSEEFVDPLTFIFGVVVFYQKFPEVVKSSVEPCPRNRVHKNIQEVNIFLVMGEEVVLVLS